MVDLGVRLGGDHGLCAIGQAEARGFDHGQVVGAVADGGGLGEVDAQPIGLRDEGGEFGLTTQDGVPDRAGEMTVFNDESVGPVLVEPGLDGDPAGKEIKAAGHEDAVDAGSRQRAHEGSGAGIEAHPLGVCALELGLRQTGEHGDPLAQGALEGELTAHGPFGNGGHLSLASSKVRQFVEALTGDDGAVHIGQQEALATPGPGLKGEVHGQVAEGGADVGLQGRRVGAVEHEVPG